MAVDTKDRERIRPRALDASTLCEAFQMTAEDNPDTVALRTKDDEVSITWSEYADKVRAIAAGLAALGVKPGDTVGLMMVNRPEFHLVDSAVMHLGATPFSIYNTYTPDQIEYLTSDAQNKILVTEQGFLDTVMKVKESDGSPVEHVIVVDGEAPEGTMSLDDLAAMGDDDFDLEASWKAVKPDDILTLIYTSGTTGPPKGVQLTHDNLISAVEGYDEMIQFPNEGRVVSWLPMAHVAERNCSHYLPILLGFTTTCCPNPREVMAYLPAVHPTWFFAVPRIWEKLKAAMEGGLEAQPEDRKKAAQHALDVGLKKVKLEQAGEEVPQELREEYEKVDRKVLSGMREMMGLDQVESVNVGAAPTPPEVIEFFHAIGIPLAELWGMSETCGAGTCNPPEKVKIGTVGPAAPHVEIKLAEDGEVLIKSRVVMAGYRNQPEKTKETIDEDGWLHTGDIGEFDEDKYLKIVDRKKELIINAAGKNMSPANIEAKIKAAGPLIGQAIAIGDARSFNTALVTLDPDTAPSWAQSHGIQGASLEDLATNEKMVEAVQEEVDAGNEALARVEQIKKFKILPTPWEPGGDELTPTAKLKRKPIAEKYADEIEELYAK